MPISSVSDVPSNEETLWPHDEHGEQDDEEHSFFHRGGDEPDNRCLNHAYKQSADHRTMEAAKAGQHNDHECREEQIRSHVRSNGPGGNTYEASRRASNGRGNN